MGWRKAALVASCLLSNLFLGISRGPRAADCNRNGVLDQADLVDGTSQDCDLNAVPDECDVARRNFVPGSPVSYAGSLSTGLAAADLEGDEDLDLLVTNLESDNISLW